MGDQRLLTWHTGTSLLDLRIGASVESVTWTWLATCRNCQKVHTYRRHNPNDIIDGGTWGTKECPMYSPRLGPKDIERLRTEQDRESVSTGG